MVRYHKFALPLIVLLATACGTFDIHLEDSPAAAQSASVPSMQPATLTPLSPASPGPGTPSALFTPAPTLQSAPPAVTRQRISFGPGVTSVMIGNTLAAGGVLEYVVAAGQGQILSARTQIDQVQDVDEPLDVSVYSLPDGRLIGGQDKGWQGSLPATQDYLIRLSGSAQALHFYLYIDIPAWIQMPANGGTVTLEGNLGPQGAHVIDGKLFTLSAASYLLSARAGQRLVVTVTSPGTIVLLNITREGDTTGPVIRDVIAGNHVELDLPADDIYRISPTNEGDQPVSFTMEVTLGP